MTLNMTVKMTNGTFKNQIKAVKQKVAAEREPGVLAFAKQNKKQRRLFKFIFALDFKSIGS